MARGVLWEFGIHDDHRDAVKGDDMRTMFAHTTLAMLLCLTACGGPPGMMGAQGEPGAPGKDATIPMGSTPPPCNEMSNGQFFVNTSGQVPRLDYCDGTKWVPSTGNLGQMVADLQAQVMALQSKRPVYTNPTTMKQYSLDAGFCGATLPFTGRISEGGLLGYEAAKAKCESSCRSPTAHLCTSLELVRYRATGGRVPAEASVLWMATGTQSRDNGVTAVHDCKGFTYEGGGEVANIWDSGVMTSWVGCNAAYPIACCD